MNTLYLMSENFVIQSKNGTKRMYDDGGISIIAHAMRHNPDDVDIHREALTLLTQLALHPPNRAIIAKNGGVKRILETFENHRNHVDVLTLVCMLLINFIVETDNMQRRNLFVRLGGIGLLLNAVAAHPTELELSRLAFAILLDSVEYSTRACFCIAESGGVFIFLNAMEYFEHNLDVQLSGANLLTKLSATSESLPLVVNEGDRVTKIANTMWKNHGAISKNLALKEDIRQACNSLLFRLSIRKYFPSMVAQLISPVQSSSSSSL
eukprot:m.74210 g.74210  ORF g.74210 m.74210 type:complete len:266 (+) comp8444_c1_seq1:275-1072(+)